LARLEDIRLWSETVQDARCEVGGVRARSGPVTCEDATIKERCLSWDEGRSFAYEGVGIPLVAQLRSEWTIQAEGEQPC
jgi:hypothetical protein